MNLNLGAINYLAVLVAGFATFMLGALWYTALFGKLWIKLHGWSEEKVKALQARLPPPIFLGGMFVCYLVIAFVMAALVTSFNLNTAADGVILGLLLWLGPAAAIAFTGQLASDKPLAVYGIDVTFQLIFLVFMGGLLAVWR